MATDLTFTQGDTAPSVYGDLTNADGTPFDLTDATVHFQMRPSIDRRFSVDGAAVVVGDPTLGSVRYDWVAWDLASAGDFVSHWRITFIDSSIEHTIPANSITVSPQ
jgi:hypothetical protein